MDSYTRSRLRLIKDTRMSLDGHCLPTRELAPRKPNGLNHGMAATLLLDQCSRRVAARGAIVFPLIDQLLIVLTHKVTPSKKSTILPHGSAKRLTNPWVLSPPRLILARTLMCLTWYSQLTVPKCSFALTASTYAFQYKC